MKSVIIIDDLDKFENELIEKINYLVVNKSDADELFAEILNEAQRNAEIVSKLCLLF